MHEGLRLNPSVIAQSRQHAGKLLCDIRGGILCTVKGHLRDAKIPQTHLYCVKGAMESSDL